MIILLPPTLINLFPGSCVAVVVYVNHGCTCGPYLDSSRVGELPLQFGPGSLNRVVRESIQALVDAAPDPRAVTSLLPQGTGKVIIKSECRVPAVAL